MMNLNKPSLFLSIKIMQGIIEINVAINMWLNSITDSLLYLLRSILKNLTDII